MSNGSSTSPFARNSDMRTVLAAVALALLLTPGLSIPGASQDVGVVQSEILVLDPERLFEVTQLGQAINAELLAEREAIIARNRALETELEAEELALTKQRDTTSPEEFRVLADAFDEKVQAIRRDSERRVRDLERNRERAPIEFMRQVEPVLQSIMREAGASIVMDRRSILLLSDVVDVTDIAAARIDASFATRETPVATGGNAVTSESDTLNGGATDGAIQDSAN